MSDTQPVPTAPEPPQQKPSILVWFAAHPIVGFVGTIASVVSLALGVVFYLATIRARELSLYVNPSKTTIVKSGQSSDLHILYRNKDVSTDVTALQVELWNAGKESIRPEHVLSPITLETSPKVPILEARIRHISRPLTQVVLDQSHIADGKIAVSWKILEHNDGAVVQFILAGPPETSVKASGALEGQSSVRVLRDFSQSKLIFVVCLLCFAVPMIAFTTACLDWAAKRIVDRVREHRSTIRLVAPTFMLVVVVVGLFAGLCIIAYRYYFGAPSIPMPFD